MDIAAWNGAGKNDGVSSGDGATEAPGGRTVIYKPPPQPPSSSWSWSWSWLRSKDPRIVRVSRAFGGKDRHSKVCTLRGLRDRRVRLSVPTAIQLYDLQHRLGVDQPSKVVDWLLDAAKDDIHDLPPLPISPHNFTFLNLNPSQEPGQLGGSSTSLANPEDKGHQGRGENDVVLGSNIHHQHVGSSSYGSYYNVEHHHHHHSGNFQTEQQQHHQNHSLVPFPSQILVRPMTTTATTQSLFPSPVEMMDPREMVSHFQEPASSQNVSALYSLIHGDGTHDTRIPVHFNHANNANANANAGMVLGSESSRSGGSDHQN